MLKGVKHLKNTTEPISEPETFCNKKITNFYSLRNLMMILIN